MGKVTELNSLVCRSLDLSVGFQGGSLVKKLCANGNTRDEASIPGLGRPPWGKKMATHSSNLDWKITWTVAWQLQFMGSQRVEHN